MFLNQLNISPASKAREIVELDYRTAAVFDDYGISYCCGIQRPLEEVCLTQKVSIDNLIAALQKAIRPISISAQTPFENWPVDFLIDYIVNVHHHYLSETLPVLSDGLNQFTKEHKDRFPAITELNIVFNKFAVANPAHLIQEEENIFPYLRQVAHAYQDEDTSSFAPLMIKTLRKPLAVFMEQDHQILQDSILQFRHLTNNYTPLTGICPSHKVLLAKLRELDNDITQHFYLENDILIPKVIRMEQELLQRNN
jgi:regulator of cell morphogenesis and NO signaling